MCVGCEACVTKCPKGCISFDEDREGFRYPKVDMELCIDCSLCERVCPVIHQDEPREPIAYYGAKNRDEKILLSSASGGLFTLLSTPILERGGVVFGVRFNDKWEAIHDYTETIEGLAPFRGSKYVQSRMGGTYNRVESFLKSGREVLFSGTPCQIAGLRRYLRKEYEGLYLVDLICHGVPSPMVWRRYLGELGVEDIKSINFRDKRTGWSILTFSVSTNTKDDVYVKKLVRDPFGKGFLKDLYLRPSCHNCPSKSLKSGADITIADYWGVEIDIPEFLDRRGVGLAVIGTKKGEELFMPLDKEMVVAGKHGRQMPLFKSVPPHKNRARFFDAIQNPKSSVTKQIINNCVDSFSKRLKLKLRYMKYRLSMRVKALFPCLVKKR